MNPDQTPELSLDPRGRADPAPVTEEQAHDKIDKLDQLITRLENTGLEEYVKLSQRTWKILGMNLLSGVARGLGFTLGTAIVLAIVYKVVKYMIEMNIPYLTEMLQEIVAIASGGGQPL